MNPSRTTDELDTPAPGLDAWGRGDAKVVSFVSHKGGVGKTTSAVNLGATFALSGHRVLLIGLDPQCGLSRSLGYESGSLRGGLSDILIAGLPLEAVIHESSLENLSFVSPDALTLSEEVSYKSALDRPDALADVLAEARSAFDTILIDCPPGFGPETRAALGVSDSYLIPVQAEELCRDSITRLLDFVREFEATSHRDLILEGLFLTMTDTRTRMSRHVSEALCEEFGDLVYACPVPRTTRLAEMAVKGRPTVIFDRRSAGSRAYFDLMDEIVARDRRRPRSRPEPAAEPASRPRTGTETASEDATESRESDSLIPSLGGLSRLMEALSADGSEIPSIRKADPEPEMVDDDDGDFFYGEDPDEPDLVSLDDLLEEEERAGRSRNEDDDWGMGGDSMGTIN